MEKPILQTKRLILRQPQSDDAKKIVHQANNINIWRNVRDLFPHPYTIDNACFFINLCQKENPIATFAIFKEEDFIGITGLRIQDDVYRNTAELGFWIGEEHWNNGYATESCLAIIDYGFNIMGLRRIYAGVFDYNLASAKVMEKCGFKKEGLLRKAVIKDREILDEIRYAILKNDIDINDL